MKRRISKNQGLKDYAREKNVFLYEIAQKLNISESYFGRLLRVELTPETECKYKAIIDEIANENDLSAV